MSQDDDIEKGKTTMGAAGASIEEQKWHTNRWLRLFTYSCACFFNTCIYYGWPQWSIMLFQDGAYAWRCTGDDEPPEDADPGVLCEKQDSAVQILYSLSANMEFIFGFVAGIILDNIGPRYCAIAGESVWGLGMLLLTFSGESFQAYIPAALFMGIGVNMVAFPALILEDFFPSHSAMVISLVIALQVTSSILPPVMELMVKPGEFFDFQTMLLFYLAICWVPVAVLYIITLPTKRPKLLEAETQREAAAQGGIVARVEEGSASNEDLDVVQRDSRKSADETGRSKVDAADGPKELTPPFTLMGFVKEILTIEFLLFTLVYVMMVLQYGYWLSTIQSRFGETFTKVIGWMMPAQGVVGVGLGMVADVIGTLSLVFMILGCAILTYGLGYIRQVGPQYLSGILFNIGQSWIYTTKYTYATEIYSATNFGKLAGLIGLCAGCFGLFNILIIDMQQPDLWYGVYLGFGVFCLPIIGYLFYRQYFQRITYKIYEKEGTVTDESLRRSFVAGKDHEAEVEVVGAPPAPPPEVEYD